MRTGKGSKNRLVTFWRAKASAQPLVRPARSRRMIRSHPPASRSWAVAAGRKGSELMLVMSPKRWGRNDANTSCDQRHRRGKSRPVASARRVGALYRMCAYRPRSCRTMWSEEFRSPRPFRRQLVCELRPLAFATARISSEMAARMARIICTTIIDEYPAGHVRSGKCSNSLDDGSHRVG
jgi:hypothetical protein